MRNEEIVMKILKNLSYTLSCANCGTRLRFGDYECPHCGRDVEEELLGWSMKLLDTLEIYFK